MPEPKDLPEGIEWSEGPKDPHRNRYRMGIAEDYPDLGMDDDDVLANVYKVLYGPPREWYEWGRNRHALRRIQQWLRGADNSRATRVADFIDAELAKLADSRQPD